MRAGLGVVSKRGTMTLVEAFRSIGCLIGDDNVDRLRRNAAAIVLLELQRMARTVARGLRFPDHMADDAAHEAFCNLMTGGNRSNAALACDSDQRVRGFLRECVRNAMLDERRRARSRYIDHQRAVEEPAHDESPEELAIASQEIERRQSADRDFYQRIVPAVAESLRAEAGRDFRQAVEHMRALVSGEIDIERVVMEATGKDDAAAHTAVHKRHSRTRRRLLEHIEALVASEDLTREQAEDLYRCVSQLHRRSASYK